MEQSQEKIINDLKGLAGIVLVSDILEKYHLTPEQVQAVFRVYRNILDRKLGLQMMAGSLVNEAGLDFQQAGRIAEEIKKEVLFEVLDDLQPKKSLAEVKMKIEEQRKARERQIMQEIKTFSPRKVNQQANQAVDKASQAHSHPQASLSASDQVKKKEKNWQQRNKEIELNSPAKQLGI